MNLAQYFTSLRRRCNGSHRSLRTSFIGAVSISLLCLPISAGLIAGGSDLETNSDVSINSKSIISLPGEIAAWLDTHASVKSQAVRIDQWIDRSLFGEDPAIGSASPRVLRGKDGFFFIADAFNEACSPHIGVIELVGRLETLTSLLRVHGIPAYVVVSPDKSTVLEDKLPDSFPLQACFLDYRDTLWSALRESENLMFIDLWTALSNARGKQREPLFKRRDTHWDDAGAVVASGAVVDFLVPGLWEPRSVAYTGLTEYYGDLNSFIGQQEVDTAPTYAVERAGVELSNVVRIDNLEPGLNRTVTTTSTGPEVVPGTTLIFGDSFTHIAEKFLEPWFEEVTFMRLVDFDQTRFSELISAHDRVIFWSVERSLPYRVAADWGTPEFLDFLANHLEAGDG